MMLRRHHFLLLEAHQGVVVGRRLLLLGFVARVSGRLPRARGALARL